MEKMMKILRHKRCIIGEGPIWNEFEKALYFTNGFGNEICRYDLITEELKVRPVAMGVSAFGFSKDGRMLVSRMDGAFYLNSDNSVEPLYNTEKYQILYGNDAKVGPDGCFYVGTQSRKRVGVSDEVDGKLYKIDKNGEVKIVLSALSLSNGFDWSMDETKLYHTDSDTGVIKEYHFDKVLGTADFTGRSIKIMGVDGFTINKNNQLVVTRWRAGTVCLVDTETMTIVEEFELPNTHPASCAFIGDSMDILAITTASRKSDINEKQNAGFTILKKMEIGGRKPYLFG